MTTEQQIARKIMRKSMTAILDDHHQRCEDQATIAILNGHRFEQLQANTLVQYGKAITTDLYANDILIARIQTCIDAS